MMYLRLMNSDPEQFTDSARYGSSSNAENPPFPAPEGFEWVEGTPPQDALPYVEPTLDDRLSTIFDAQTVELRAQFAPLRAAVRTELQLGHADVAEAIIAQADIPVELEPIRTALLAEFA